MSERIVIKEICEVYDGPHATPKKTVDGPVYLGIDAITDDGKINAKEFAHLSEEDYIKWTKRVTPQYGDIVFSYEATLGRYALIPKDFYGCLGRRLAIIRNVSKDIDTLWLYYYFLSPEWKQFIQSKIIKGSTVNRISVEDFPTYTVPNISIKVQRKIANILSKIDEKIALNNNINDNLQQQAFSVFDNLIANAENNDYTVSDYAFLNPKRTLAKNQVARSIDMSQLSTSGAFPSGWEMKPFNGGMRFTNGDTLLARITPCLENGKTAFIDFLDDGEVAFGSTEYIVLAPKNDTPPEMLYCLARYPAFVDYAVKNMNGSSGRQRVSAETVGQYRLPLFDKHSLVLFKEVVSPMFLKMRYNSLENMRLAELRDALLPKLMSGEIDVSAVQL